MTMQVDVQQKIRRTEEKTALLRDQVEEIYGQLNPSQKKACTWTCQSIFLVFDFLLSMVTRAIGNNN